MKPEALKPIPIPAAQRLRRVRTQWLPPIIFGGALLIILLLWKDNVGAPSMVGLAEPVVSHVTSHQSGVLVELSVQRFERVRAGQILGKVLIADPKTVEASLAVVRAEIEMIRNDPQLYVPEQRFAVDYAQLRLDSIGHRADLATAKINLQFAEVELKRNEALLKDKLIAVSVFDLSKANRDVLLEQVEELGRLVNDSEQTLKTLQSTNTAPPNYRLLSILTLQESQLRLTEAELSPIILRASIDGIITTVSNHPGESVTAGRPIVTIATMNPVRVVGYLRPPLSTDPKPGMRVEVRTRGVRRQSAESLITEVGTQFEALPAALQSAMRLATVEMGLPIEVSLPPGLGLRAGELVDIRLLSPPVIPPEDGT